ncbi:LLM class flavin-dependent oxidoreductase [Rhizorhapis suberifaciens]|uniref:Alkanesulfonate monooxygenase SsuD/methylene tetrahydromethanopterin reductase-like flavin-dependent oxidoreductase (Luciferase family) n=1 Tax=Rhizorhapis suberifaciens TaxID=13656 RepID=A0A840HRJ2_9SPHN|nr:LLM class flavin-dependent oxidoreductase [Rhizorhapis suberifaciens]MBB4640208.1 alkanesulfonate monooxygenase SsuD/methylene tetrahydromethanopterin reductase-like flavin-dependent oxidoreductase (luciferase family) [Rhizorhapis suberifaciens]
MIKAWVFEQMNISTDEDPSSFDIDVCRKEYAWRIDLGTRAEALGFYGIFFSEHHFAGVRACPSPSLLAAAVASRTTTLRVGVLGWVLPMSQPWRLLEEIAVLDHLSQGRVEVGVARGSHVKEAKAIGIAEDDVPAMFEEALDILDKGWRSVTLLHEGRHWSFGPVAIIPRPIQMPAPPIWATARSAASATAAARRGYKLCTGFLPTTQIKRLFDNYRVAAAAAEQPYDAERLAFRRCVFVAPSATEATEHMYAAREQMPAIVADDIIAGTPSDVADQIVAQAREVGATNFVGFFAGNLRDRRSIEQSYQLFGSKVIPSLVNATD